MTKLKGKGIASVERLVHFNCPHCKKWWSIGDAYAARKSYFCPWCGLQSEFEQRDEPDKNDTHYKLQ